MCVEGALITSQFTFLQSQSTSARWHHYAMCAMRSHQSALRPIEVIALNCQQFHSHVLEKKSEYVKRFFLASNFFACYKASIAQHNSMKSLTQRTYATWWWKLNRCWIYNLFKKWIFIANFHKFLNSNQNQNQEKKIKFWKFEI